MGVDDDARHLTVLTMDIAGSTGLAMEKELEARHTLEALVCDTSEYQHAEQNDAVIPRWAGDKAVLGFDGDARQALRLAIAVGQRLKACDGPQVRAGLHFGPVYCKPDPNGQLDMIGKGADWSTRVMEAGDPGHLIVSRAAVDQIIQFGGREWEFILLGLWQAKDHDPPIEIYNLCHGDVGNPWVPEKFENANMTGLGPVVTESGQPGPAGVLAPAADADSAITRAVAEEPGDAAGLCQGFVANNHQAAAEVCDGLARRESPTRAEVAFLVGMTRRGEGAAIAFLPACRAMGLLVAKSEHARRHVARTFVSTDRWEQVRGELGVGHAFAVDPQWAADQVRRRLSDPRAASGSATDRHKWIEGALWAMQAAPFPKGRDHMVALIDELSDLDRDFPEAMADLRARWEVG